MTPSRVVLELTHNLELLRIVLEFNTYLDPFVGRSRTYTQSRTLTDRSRQIVLEFNTYLDPFVGRSRTYTQSRTLTDRSRI